MVPSGTEVLLVRGVFPHVLIPKLGKDVFPILHEMEFPARGFLKYRVRGTKKSFIFAADKN
jgi:hypothetical protein